MSEELNGQKMLLHLLQETRDDLAALRAEVHALRLEQAQRRGIERAAFWMASVIGALVALIAKWALNRFAGA
jgi:lipid-A-disaccharide synthase-like uncharacterized protein